MENMITQAQAMKEELLEIRRALHQNPEVGSSLPKTKAYVMEKLREYGYEPQEICESGIVATLKGTKPGKTLLLRADMDALPVNEEADCDFKADNGCMHACGHDMHTAMLLGAAKLLQNNRELLKGTIKLVFQPDEEGFTGAKRMIEAGVLKHPDVDAAMALHVHSGTPSNLVLIGRGTSIAGCNKFRITVKGTGAHGAMPELGVDPINIAAHIYLAIQEITAREISATIPAVVTIGRFEGGTAANIIPEEVIMEGTIRALSKEAGEFIFERMKEITDKTAGMFRGEAVLESVASAPPLTNDDILVEKVSGYLRDLFGEKSVVVFSNGGMGSEDFDSYSQEVPSIYLMLGAGTKQENPLFGEAMHNPKVVFSEDILVTGAAIHAFSAIRLLAEETITE